MLKTIPNIEDLHQCKKSEGKIVCINVNDVGITRCSYCNEIVNYSPLWNNEEFQIRIKEYENGLL